MRPEKAEMPIQNSYGTKENSDWDSQLRITLLIYAKGHFGPFFSERRSVF